MAAQDCQPFFLKDLMKVYQIIIDGPMGQTLVGDIFWHKESAEKEFERISKDKMFQFFFPRIIEKHIKE